MADVTPAGVTAGTANRGSVVHASDASLGDLSRSHSEEGISRLQSAIRAYDAALPYELGDLVREAGLNYINVTAIPVPEAFDVTKWNFIDNGLGIIFVAYNTDLATNNQFFVVNGGASEGIMDEDNAQAPVAGDFRLSFYTLEVQSNTLGTATEWKFRKNGADGNGLITVGAGLTGTFQDAISTDDMLFGDLINYQIVEGGGVGALTLIGTSCATSRTPV